MATPVNRLGFFALRYFPRISQPRRRFPPLTTFRNLHTISIRHREASKDASENANENASEDAPKEFVFDVSSLSPEERNTYDHLSPEEKLEYEEDSRKLHEHMNSPSVQSELTAVASTAAAEVLQQIPPEDLKVPRIKAGLMAMGEEDEQGTGEDEDFQGDDITSLAHGELEQHREMRQYARIAAWEMPLLSSVYMRTSAARYMTRLTDLSRTCEAF